MLLGIFPTLDYLHQLFSYRTANRVDCMYKYFIKSNLVKFTYEKIFTFIFWKTVCLMAMHLFFFVSQTWRVLYCWFPAMSADFLKIVLVSMGCKLFSNSWKQTFFKSIFAALKEPLASSVFHFVYWSTE